MLEVQKERDSIERSIFQSQHEQLKPEMSTEYVKKDSAGKILFSDIWRKKGEKDQLQYMKK